MCMCDSVLMKYTNSPNRLYPLVRHDARLYNPTMADTARDSVSYRDFSHYPYRFVPPMAQDDSQLC